MGLQSESKISVTGYIFIKKKPERDLTWLKFQEVQSMNEQANLQSILNKGGGGAILTILDTDCRQDCQDIPTRVGTNRFIPYFSEPFQASFTYN